MVSTYSTDLKIELMVTGENAGTWGNKTNDNLNVIQQAIAGYGEQSIAGGAQTTPLTIANSPTLSVARNVVLKFTGTITGNQIVTIPDGIEKTWILYNGTSGAFTVQFKTVSGTGPTFSTTDKGFKLVYSNGTDVTDVPLGVPGGSNTQIQFNSSGSFGASANLVWDGTNFIIDSEGALRLGDNTGSAYVGLKAPATITGDTAYTLTLPTATGTANQVLTTDGSGNLSFATVSGGAAWQAVKTGNFNVTAKEGYFVNTTSGAITATLPGSPTIGDFVSFVDYAGTFDTNNFTVARNGNPIQGSATDLTVATERAGFTLVYVDATQGWLLQNN
jgi:hypothetical protein